MQEKKHLTFDHIFFIVKMLFLYFLPLMPMKKLFWILLWLICLSGIGTAVEANCITANFENGDSACIALDKSWSRYTARVQSSNLSSSLNNSLVCELLLPNQELKLLGACNGSFSYSSSSTQTIRLYVRYSNRYYDTIDASYNFSNGTRTSGGSSSGGGSSNNSNVRITTNQSSPNTNQYVNATVEVNSSYRGRVDFYVQYRSSNSSSRSTVTSSTYFDGSSLFNNGYQFTSSDYGYKTFSSFIRFNRSGYFRVYAKDNNGNENYVEFDVNGSSSNNNNLRITSNQTYPTTNQYVNATVETSSSYRGRVDFYVQYRQSTSSSRSTVTSSSYFDASSSLNNGYQFTSSDYGYKTFSSFIRFNKTGYYRLYVRDNNGNENYVEFNVDASSSTNNNVRITTNQTYPSTNQYVNVTVETNSSYRGRIDFSMQYRSSNSSSRSTVTSSSYFDASSYFNNGYQFTSSDYGYKTLSSFVRFNRSGYYRLYAKDDNGNENYVEFNVDTSSSSSNNNLRVTTNQSYPDTNQYVNATVEVNSSYRGRVDFSMQYRSSSSSSRSTVTSSSYYDASSYFNNGYQFTSSDYGYKTFSSFVRFNRTGYYRLYVRDNDGNENYVEFNVDTSSSSNNNNLRVTTNQSYPSTNQYVNVTVETSSSYRGRVEFSVQYRSSNSSSRSTVTSSSYYDAGSYFNNGYQFTSSDYGYRTFNSLVRFNRSGYYRLYVRDNNGNESYASFTVDTSGSSSSSIDGFSSTELRKITRVSEIWNSMMTELKRTSSKLRNDTYRQRLSDTFYNNMRDVVNDRYNRVFNNWRDFLDAFNEWYRYTSRNS